MVLSKTEYSNAVNAHTCNTFQHVVAFWYKTIVQNHKVGDVEIANETKTNSINNVSMSMYSCPFLIVRQKQYSMTISSLVNEIPA